MHPGLCSNHGSEAEVLDVMFSFVVDLANNFDFDYRLTNPFFCPFLYIYNST